MKKLFLIPAICIILLSACSKTTVITERLSSCDSLMIEFYALDTVSMEIDSSTGLWNHQWPDSVLKTFQATDKIALRKMVSFIDRKVSKEYKCGYDGSLIFFKAGKPILPVVFKYKDPACRHFLFELDGKVQSTEMNQEGADFLETLEKGRSN